MYLRRWDGAAWQELAGSATCGGVSGVRYGMRRRPAVAVDHLDRPIVVWTESSRIRVRRWNGIAWEDMPSVSAGRTARSPAIAVDSAGHPAITWGDNSSGRWQVFFKCWNGDAWIELAGSASGRGVSDTATNCYFSPALAFDTADRPLVAAQVIIGCRQMRIDPIFLKRWNGCVWVGLGASATTGITGDNAGPSGATMTPSLVIDACGRPAVAWYDTTCPSPTGPAIYVKRWTPAP